MFPKLLGHKDIPTGFCIHVPDLLKAIIQPPVKEELRPILSKMIQFGLKIKKIRVSTFWIPETSSFPARGQHNFLAQ